MYFLNKKPTRRYNKYPDFFYDLAHEESKIYMMASYDKYEVQYIKEVAARQLCNMSLYMIKYKQVVSLSFCLLWKAIMDGKKCFQRFHIQRLEPTEQVISAVSFFFSRCMFIESWLQRCKLLAHSVTSQKGR